MQELSPFRRFVRVWRDYGPTVAFNVVYSKLRGRIFPHLAMPGAPVYGGPRRELSFILRAETHGPATIAAVVGAIAARGDAGWEVCIGDRQPPHPETADLLGRLHGTRPWVRIISAQDAVDDAMASQWTIEQATGDVIALVAPGYAPTMETVSGAMERLRQSPDRDALSLVQCGAAGGGPGDKPCLFLQRKSSYLAAFDKRWPLTAADAAREFAEMAGADCGIVLVAGAEV